MTKEAFLRMFEETVMVAPHSLGGDEALDDLKDWDSLAVMAFLVLADEHFSTRLSQADLSRCRTVNDLWSVLRHKVLTS